MTDSGTNNYPANVFIDVLLKGTGFPGYVILSNLEWGLAYHGYNRKTGHVGEVMTAINGTLRLQSDSEVRYLIWFNSYIHRFYFISWPVTHAQRAPGSPLQVSNFSDIYIYTILI